MKKIASILTIIMTAFVLTSTAHSAVGVIDMDAIIQKSNVWQSVRGDIKKYALNVQRQVMEEQVILESLWTDIKKMRNDKSDSNKIIALEKKFKEGRSSSQGYVQTQKKKMDNAFLIAKKKINDKIKKIVQKITDENGYDVVVGANNVVYFKDKISITEEVLLRLNKQMSSVDLKFDEGQ